jgi:hypothetical protein
MSGSDSGEFIEVSQVPPTSKTIEDMAVYLGADRERDRDLFHIAQAALTASLPNGWQHLRRADGTGEPFFFNFLTGQSLWTDPSEKYYRSLMADAIKRKSLNPHNSLEELSVRTTGHEQSPSAKRATSREQELLRRELEAEIESIRTEHQKQLEALRSEQSTNVTNLEKLQTVAIQEIRATFEKEKSDIEAQLTEFTQKKADAQSAEIEILKSLHREELEQLRSDHALALESVQKAHETEMSAIKGSLIADEAQAGDSHGQETTADDVASPLDNEQTQLIERPKQV